MFSHGYCKLFVDADVPADDLAITIARHLSGKVEGFSVYTDILTLDVMRNEESTIGTSTTLKDDFLYYPLFLDISPNESTDRDRYIEAVGHLLEFLWGLGHRAVAACSFEDSLPRKGGLHG